MPVLPLIELINIIVTYIGPASFGFYKVGILGYDILYKKIYNRLGAGFIPW